MGLELKREVLRGLAARASTLFERLDSDTLRCEADERVDARLEAWCQASAGGDQARFERRLELDGLTVEDVRSALGAVRFTGDDTDLPAWTGTFRTLLSGMEGENARTHRCLDPDEPVSFEQVLVPFVAEAGRQLTARAGAACGMLTEAAHAALERDLLARLSGLCDRSLDQQFSSFRTGKQGKMATLAGLFLPDPSRDQYRAFVQAMLGGEWVAVFRTYPVLARGVATTVDLWLEATAEFLARLEADRAVLGRVFGGRDGVDPVVAVDAGISDLHNRGRSVLVLTFDSGLKLVYKPKPLATEAAYSGLQRWLNERGASPPFKVLRVLDRSAYGWVEHAAHLPCPDGAAAERFYQRAGMLLCLLYVLEVDDCHQENLIACGEYPVLVDQETIMCPKARIPGMDMARIRNQVYEQIGRSVLSIGLLPQWIDLPDGAAYDISGLAGVEEHEVEYRLVWRPVESDRVELGPARQRFMPDKNVVMLEGRPLQAHEFVEDIVTGFRSMFSLLIAQREALLAPDGPLAPLAGQKVRFLLRSTSIYQRLLARLTQPHHLKDGADHSIQMEVLSRGLVKPDHALFWPAAKAEREAMERLDVPHFSAPADSDALPLPGGGLLKHCFEGPGYDRILTRIRELNEADMERQVRLIRGSLLARGAASIHGPSAPAEETVLSSAVPLGRDALVEQAVGIGRDLANQAIRSDAGEATWMAPTYNLRVDRFQFMPLGFDLYSGGPGVSLFLAALEGITCTGEFRELALGALAPLREILHDPGEHRLFVQKMGIGGASGLGSIVYTLLRAGVFLEDERLIDDAGRAAALITPEQIETGPHLDVIGGCAGALLGLLALHDRTDDPGVLDQAVGCGRRLLETREASPAGPRAWQTSEGKHLTGFSHGAAGIAYALTRLYRATGEGAFLDAAEEGIAFEQRVFVEEEGNWPDFRPRPEGEPPFRTGWCHGAPGIGLARLGGLEAIDTPRVRAEIETALETTLSFGIAEKDHLCCGNLGRTELMVTAAQRLDRPGWMDTAQRQTAQLVERAKRTGTFGYPKGLYGPGFFTGSSGMGYQLLRLACPDRIPPVLLWA